MYLHENQFKLVSLSQRPAHHRAGRQQRPMSSNMMINGNEVCRHCIVWDLFFCESYRPHSAGHCLGKSCPDLHLSGAGEESHCVWLMLQHWVYITSSAPCLLSYHFQRSSSYGEPPQFLLSSLISLSLSLLLSPLLLLFGAVRLPRASL